MSPSNTSVPQVRPWRLTVDRARVLVTGPMDERVIYYGRGEHRRAIGIVIGDPRAGGGGRPWVWCAIPMREIKRFRTVLAESKEHKDLVSPHIALNVVLGPQYSSIRGGAGALVAHARRRLV